MSTMDAEILANEVSRTLTIDLVEKYGPAQTMVILGVGLANLTASIGYEGS